MNSTKNISAWQFATFRIVFGFYLAWHFAALLPYAGELFSAGGVLPSYELNFTHKAFPDVLAFARTAWQAQLFVSLLYVCAISFGLGLWRRVCALILWYGWASLFNRNNLISNPGIPYVGLLLAFCAIVPSGEPLSLRGKRDTCWRMPAMIYWGAWFLLAAGYAYSAVWKLISPSWQDGSALHHLLTNPLARPGFFRNLILALPSPVLVALTWLALAGELATLPLSMFRTGRLIAWTWMLAMHLGLLLVVDFADLTLGMLMIHFFTFDPDWLSRGLAARLSRSKARTSSYPERRRSTGTRPAKATASPVSFPGRTRAAALQEPALRLRDLCGRPERSHGRAAGSCQMGLDQVLPECRPQFRPLRACS